MRHIHYVVIIIWRLFAAGLCDSIGRLPPSIVKHPLKYSVYRLDTEITLECLADGVPTPEYHWRKDGIDLDPLPNVIYSGDGTLRFLSLSTLDEGYYQCLAFNDYGVAMSTVAVLRRALITASAPLMTRQHNESEGRQFMLRCQPSKSFPSPYYSWYVGPESKPVKQDRRIQFDDSGNLHFAYLIRNDSYGGLTYKCVVTNAVLALSYGGSYALINVIPVEKMEDFGPVYAFSTPSPITALEGTSIKLRCFFYGKPIPDIHWHGENDDLSSSDRFILLNDNTELLIMNVTLADEMVYTCSANNSDVIVMRRISVIVDVAPTFLSPLTQPQNVNKTEGDSVTFICRVNAKPPATVTWSRNGASFEAGKLPARYSLTDDGSALTISDLCIECPGGLTDFQVIQCNSSNAHGYAFGSGYINILRRTIVVASPLLLSINASQRAVAKFSCVAQSDESTPVVIQWYRASDDGLSQTELVDGSMDGVSVVDNNQSLIFRASPGSLKWFEYGGVYRCKGDNGYSSSWSEICLDVLALPVSEKPQIPEITTSDSVTVTVPPAIMVTAGNSLPWIVIVTVVVIVAITVLTLFIILRYGCRGDKYNVDKHEQHDGKNPEKELKNKELQEYQRPLAASVSRTSLVTSSSHDDEPNEFGDDDDTMFHENGSFIGEYVR